MNKEIFIKRLKHELFKYNLNTNLLAQISNIEQTQIDKYICGLESPTDIEVKILSSAFGINNNYLLGNSDNIETDTRQIELLKIKISELNTTNIIQNKKVYKKIKRKVKHNPQNIEEENLLNMTIFLCLEYAKMYLHKDYIELYFNNEKQKIDFKKIENHLNKLINKL